MNVTVAQALNSAALEAVSKADSPDEERSAGNGEFILLSDARFEATTPVVNFPILTVFCDQIIAVSLGTDPARQAIHVSVLDGHSASSLPALPIGLTYEESFGD